MNINVFDQQPWRILIQAVVTLIATGFILNRVKKAGSDFIKSDRNWKAIIDEAFQIFGGLVIAALLLVLPPSFFIGMIYIGLKFLWNNILVPLFAPFFPLPQLP